MLLPPFPRRQVPLGPVALVPALAGADPRRLTELVPHTDRLRLPPGRVLALAGATARELVVLVEGHAAVLGPDGRREVIGPDTEIGGAELLTHARHPATVVTVSEVEVVVVSGPAMRWAFVEGLAQIEPAPVAVDDVALAS